MGEMLLLPYRSFGAKTTDTNALVVYTCPTGMLAQVTEILISDDAADGRTATITWTDSSATVTYTIAFGWVIPPNLTMQQTFNRLALDAGDTVSVTGSAAGMNITVNVIEYARTLPRRS